ncbi:hypothetical protein ENUP19_0121G0155 [Entamoeba nuttalli]|uniref:Phosphatidylinositol-3,4,5-trisphosphate 3-phosphatase, putative n=2 Tax=Entamoeba nuttalli TaxID=412467 RepID=K2GYX4_ENTNP|nr:phosphatidylinositol-3,4,5-trisphosphate 3-phosphatase, putative [Entamoeba nuttalli P19]EKE39052.1 phosphatidylinositol-3,4,5-trisphosphate 3-phosphatase, putative [Entamoeba nuttalli P19]|eukprot:XP_008858620.1 phosphatidylinositol-3,4,5-trisphosphate 3-phosphatase, putative [Entamoeba nuttalli P19]
MLRRIVADDKYMITADGKDLDLTYILPNLIAMGIPTTGIFQQWRNSKEEIAKYLNNNYFNNYMIWNLTEKSYTSLEFNNRVQHVGFLDHHPPRFNHLLKIVGDIVDYVLECPKHIACVHCKAGRGRTGLVCSCVLLSLGKCGDAKKALELFARKRSKIMKGATSPPQIRYCYYFYYYLSVFPREVPFKPIPSYSINLSSVLFTGFKPTITVKDSTDCAHPVLYFNPLSHAEPHPHLFKCSQSWQQMSDGCFIISFIKQPIVNDTVISLTVESKEKSIIIGKVILNAFFIDVHSQYTLKLDQVQDPTEGVNRNSLGLPPHFSMTFRFKESKREEDSIEELHEKIVTITKQFPLDEMHRVLPPPIPFKPGSGNKKALINSTPRGSRKKQYLSDVHEVEGEKRELFGESISPIVLSYSTEYRKATIKKGNAIKKSDAINSV